MTTPLMLTPLEVRNITEGAVDYIEELPPIHPSSYYMLSGRRAIASICGSVFVGPNTTMEGLMRKSRANSLKPRRADPGYFVFARAAAALLFANYSDVSSYPMIGRMLALDHTTIIHALRGETQRKYLQNEIYAKGLIKADRRVLGMVAASWSWLKDAGGADAFLKAHKDRIAEERRVTGPRSANSKAYTIINEAYRAVTGRDSPVLLLRDTYPARPDDLGAQGGGCETLAWAGLQSAGEHWADLPDVRPVEDEARQVAN